MKCHTCGAALKGAVADLPFTLEANRIVILKGLPVLQCSQCGDYLIEDPVMARVEDLLARADASAELEVFRYAA